MSLVIALSITAALVQAPAAAGTASVSGQVLEDGSGIPVQDADVTLAPIQSRPFAGSPWERVEPLRLRTDREGRFHVRELAPGRYHIAVQKNGYANPFGPSPLTVVELAAGEDHAVTLSLQRGAAIVGRVLDEAGEPLMNLRVMAMRQPPSGVRYAPTSRPALVPAGSGGQTNDLGEFRLFGLPPGDYYVQAAPGPEPGRSLSPRARTLVPTYFPDTTDPAAAQVINLGAGQTSDAIIIRVADAPAFQVSGIVVDETGRPVANATVRLDSDPADGLTFPFGRSLQARTNASGAFTISNVTSATYTLVAIAPQVTSSGTDSRVTGGGGSVVSFGSASSGGPVRHGVMTESRDGITTYYRDEDATRVAISVTQADVNGLQVVVRLPQR